MMNLITLLSFTSSLSLSYAVCHHYCMPGWQCWPSTNEITAFSATVTTGTKGVVLPGSVSYKKDIVMKDLLYTKDAGMMVYVNSIPDVQKTMIFAKIHRIRFVVRSTGHSFLGRSSATGSLTMDVSLMKHISVDLDSPLNQDGVVTVGAGNTWEEVYKEVDKYGRVVVGGSAHTVSVSGYTMGGGHSPLSRSLGLAVDNVLSFTVITSDGLVRIASAAGMTTYYSDGSQSSTTNGDLFYALRGGGGGTYGVVTSLTFKLHKPPRQFIQLLCYFPYTLSNGTIIGDDILNKYNTMIGGLPKQWGGYKIISSSPSSDKTDSGSILFSMLHYGGWDLPSSNYLEPIAQLFIEDQPSFFRDHHGGCKYVNYTTFWEYEKTIQDGANSRFYLSGHFLPLSSFTPALTDLYRDDIINNPLRNNANFVCTAIHIGGEAGKVDPNSPTAVSDDFRRALVTMACAVGWTDKKDDAKYMNALDDFQAKFGRIGQGAYFNEASANLRSWKVEFWGNMTNYNRLLSIKRKFDPNGFFRCNQCVGSDEPYFEPQICDYQILVG